MIINDKIIDAKEFQRGIQIILEAFSEQKKQYIQIINSLNEKIISLEQQVNELKEENSIYRKKLHNLQNKIKCISKSICQLKDDEMLINDEDNEVNIDKKENNNLNENESRWKSLMNENSSKEFFQAKRLINKEMIKKNNIKNKYFNELNHYTRDNDISVNKKDKIYTKAINKILSNRISKNKKEIKIPHHEIINEDFNKYYEYREENNKNSEHNMIKND